MVYAGNPATGDNPECIEDEFAEGTDYSGQIVICDRGSNGRVLKSQLVAELGAVGFVLVNDPLNSASLGSDEFAVPGVHLSDVDGGALKDLVADTTSDTTATISPSTAVVDEDFGLLQASFSSRGRNGGPDYLTPDVTAPGVDIIAAVGIATEDDDEPVEWGFLSGTSMSSPHVAGSGALLSSANPDWTPAEIQSALMLTARYEGLLKEDNTTPSDPYDHGAGYVDVQAANNTGLIMDTQISDYDDANPAEGGDPTSLNHASLSNQECLDTCAWTRTLTPVVDGEWTVSVVSDDDLTLTTSADSVTTTAGTDFDLDVVAAVPGAPVGEPLFGRVILTPSDSSVSVAHLTVAVIPSAGVIPDEIVLDTRRDAGSTVVEGLETIAADPLEIEVNGLASGDVEAFEVAGDPTNDDPYNGDGTTVTLVDVPEGTSRFVAQTISSESPDLDLFVGTGDTPSADTEICFSASANAFELCDIPDPEAGTYWIMVQNWSPSAPDAVDAYELSTVLVGGDEDNLTVTPSITSPALKQAYDLTVAYDLEMEPGQSYFGMITLAADGGEIGEIPIRVNRLGDDVVKTADSEEANQGDTVGYTIAVADNPTDADIVYEIVDELPDGLELVEDSILVDGESSSDVSVDGDTLTWTPTQPTLAGLTGSYEVVTGVESDSCFIGYSYFDYDGLIPPDPLMDGDVVAVSAFAGGNPTTFYDSPYAGVTVTDNGYIDMTYDGVVYDSVDLTDPAAPNGIIAALLQDFTVPYDPTPGAETGVRLGANPDGSVWGRRLRLRHSGRWRRTVLVPGLRVQRCRRHGGAGSSSASHSMKSAT